VLIVICDPVTGEIAVPNEFENIEPNACKTAGVFDFLEIRIATIAIPTIARKIEKKLSRVKLQLLSAMKEASPLM
jgi:hypothetical protein